MAGGIQYMNNFAVIQKVTNLPPLGLKWVRMVTLRHRASLGYLI